MWHSQERKEQACHPWSGEEPYFNPLKRMLTALHWVALPLFIVTSGRHPDGLPPQPPRLCIERAAAVAAPPPVAVAAPHNEDEVKLIRNLLHTYTLLFLQANRELMKDIQLVVERHNNNLVLQLAQTSAKENEWKSEITQLKDMLLDSQVYMNRPCVSF